jgi:hypothetical protein
MLNNKYVGNFKYEYNNISQNRDIRAYYLRTDITLVSNHCGKVYRELYQYSFNEYHKPPTIYRNYNLLDNGFSVDFKNLPNDLIDSFDKKRTIDS